MQSRTVRVSIASLVMVLAASLVATAAWSDDLYVVIAGKRAKRTILVSPESTAIASGTALRNALNGIADASATNPYLVVIEPGVYDVGSTGLAMKSYVDVQGSGEGVTTITGDVNSSGSGVLNCASNTELRSLTVQNSPADGNATAIRNVFTTNVAITHVTAIASGIITSRAIYNGLSTLVKMTQVTATASGGTDAYGVSNHWAEVAMNRVTARGMGAGQWNAGVHNLDCDGEFLVTMTDVTAAASGGTTATGVRNVNSEPRMTQLMAKASDGTSNLGVWNTNSSNVHIDHSVIVATGLSGSVYSDDTSHAFIGNTRLEGEGLVSVGAGTICAGTYDENYAFVAGPACAW